MAQVISTVQRKGGVSKSTLTVCLAAFFAKDGAKCAIIDTDPQQTCMQWMEKKDCGVDVLYHTDDETLLEAINELSKTFDVILIDTAGFQSAMAVYAISASDLILVPTHASEPDAAGAIKTIRHINNVTVNNKSIPEVRAVFTNIDKNTNITNLVLSEFNSQGIRAIESPLWHRTGFKEIHSTGGLPTGSALKNLNEFVAAMQIAGLIDYYKKPKALLMKEAG